MPANNLAALFSTWQAPIKRWLATRSSIPTADIDDLAQEVFLRVLRYSDDVLITNPQSYLFRIAANVANEWRERSRNAHPHDDEGLEDIEIERGTPDDILSAEEFEVVLYRALETLPPRQAYLLMEHAFEKLTYKQIADKYHLTYRTVLRDLARAYAALRNSQALQDYMERIPIKRGRRGASF